MTFAPKVNGPRDLPDWRLWLVDQWSPGHAYERTYSAGHVALAAFAGDPAAIGSQMAKWERRTVETAALYWVSDDMTDLIYAAAPDVPGDYVLHLDDAADIAGCVVFAHTLEGIDANDPDRVCRVDAMVWGPIALPSSPKHGRPKACSGIGISMYHRASLGNLDGPSLRLLKQRGALDDLVGTGGEIGLTIDDDAIAESGGQFRPLAPGETIPEDQMAFVEGHHSEWPDGMEGILAMPDKAAMGSAVFDARTKAYVIGHEDDVVWIPLGRSDWIIGESLDTPIVTGLDDLVVASMREDRQWLAALWLLARQVNVSDRTTEMPDRPARRRSERAKMDPRVTVVKLRRLRETAEDPDHDGTPGPKREWHHRWIVGGHWRNQAYGPGRSLRRPVWIAPYVKGPEGKPLVARPKVKALVR